MQRKTELCMLGVMSVKDRDRLVYADPEEAIAVARQKGWSNEKIILKLVSGRVYDERLAIAKKYAPIMESNSQSLWL